MKQIRFFLLLALLLSFGFQPAFGAITAPVEFTILHTSDIHAHLLPFDCASGTAMGGYARIKSYKEQLEARGRKVIMLSSGDVFQGTLFFRFFNGHPDVSFMNRTGYAAMTLGNHEFDRGQEGLYDAFVNAKFPLLAANLRFTRMKDLDDLVIPSIMLSAGDPGNTLKIGIVGLTDEKLYEDVPRVFLKGIEVETAEKALGREVPFLQNRGADVIIALAHLGWDREVELADKFPQLSGVFGGHSHLFINPPQVREVPRGHQFIAQSGEFGRAVTRLDLRVTPVEGKPRLEVLAAGLIPMDSSLPEDATISQEATALWKQVEEKVNVPLGESVRRLEGDKPAIRQRETNLGNLVADSMLTALPADIALINGGGVRTSIATGVITIGDCLNVLPFDNYLVELTMTGETLQKLFDQVWTGITSVPSFGGFLHVSDGFQVKYSADGAILLLNGKPLSPAQTYKVVTNDFLANGGNGLTAFTLATASATSAVLGADALMQKVKLLKTVDYQEEGRITIAVPQARFRIPGQRLKIPFPRD